MKKVLALTMLILSLLSVKASTDTLGEIDWHARNRYRAHCAEKPVDLYCRTGSYQEADSFDVISYLLDVKFDIAGSVISGTVTMEAQSLMDGLNGLSLHLVQLVAHQVTMGIDTLDYVHEDGGVNILLDTALAQGDTFQLEIGYHGTPINDGWGGFFFYPKVTYSVGVGLSTRPPSMGRYWFPCHDVPHDKVTCEIVATVPTGYMVASNGLLLTVMETDSTVTYRWVEDHPIATYLMMVAISDYATFSHWYHANQKDSMEILYFVFPEDSTKAVADFQRVPEMVELFSTKFVPYPFSKYGLAETFLSGAMEHQSCVTLGNSLITGNNTYEYLLAHELAHQWWGDLVTLGDWRDVWLNEGMATYCEAVYAEHRGGDAAYREYMLGLANYYFSRERVEGRFPIYDPEVLWGATTYEKGACVLHMLRYIVGEEDFWAGLVRYAQTHAYGNAITPDLKAVFEAESGMDLDWFFQQWIYQQGYPEYWVGWTSSGPPWEVNVLISQVQDDAPAFSMPVEMTVVTAEGEETDTALIDEQYQMISIPVEAEPVDLKFDPRGWVLKKVYSMTSPLLSLIGQQIDDSSGDGNGRPDPGETVSLMVSVVNAGLDAEEVSLIFRTDDPTIDVLDSTAVMGPIAYRDTVHNLTDPLVFIVDFEALGHVATFHLEMAATGGYSEAAEFKLIVGSPDLLLVDDDGGASYEEYYTDVLWQLVPFDTWEVATQGPPDDTLERYQMAIWFIGDDSTTALTSDEQSTIEAFLDAGGALLLTGQNIGWDLVDQGSAADSAFYANCLHADYLGDNPTCTALRGVANDPISEDFVSHFLTISGGTGADNQTSQSVIRARSPAHAIFNYLWGPQQERAGALRYENGHKLVYLAFGFEGISDADDRLLLLWEIIDWFGWIGVEDESLISPPGSFFLSQNYPNPFNSATEIVYVLPVDCRVRLEIFNVLGQRVRTLVDGDQTAGYKRLSWNGRDDRGAEVASGIYLYRLRAGEVVARGKAVLLR